MEKEPECTQFIAEIPTVWDKRPSLWTARSASMPCCAPQRPGVGVGGLNGWKGRDVEIDLSFLPEGEVT